MLIKQLIEVFDLLDSSTVTGADVVAYLKGINPNANVETYPLVGPRGKTDMVKVRIPGTSGKTSGGIGRNRIVVAVAIGIVVVHRAGGSVNDLAVRIRDIRADGVAAVVK